MSKPVHLDLTHPRLVLASSSPYRRDLLERLQIPFAVEVPSVDESASYGELPSNLARRLARAKALAVADLCPGRFIVGSDQVVDIDGQVVSKPGDFDRACAQLRAVSGKSLCFHTALCVVAPDGGLRERTVDTQVWFRTLDEASIVAYVAQERPYDCAGAFKVERLGITLIEKISSADSTALIGLPLIALVTLSC
ncbi:MAG: septum formation protein Maf [Gammaproteobacteria bacterium]|nr:septum formation protein Maf [Gammaproteobacteria bacterium]